MSQVQTDSGDKVEITIRGQRYTFRADASDVSIREVARYVDDKMSEVAETTMARDPYTLALLTALNIASDHRRLQRAVEQELSGIESSVDEALRGLEGDTVSDAPN